MKTTIAPAILTPHVIEEAVRLDFPGFKKAIAPYYTMYLQDISEEDMAMSLNSAVTLVLLCKVLRPSSALDLGSGFSSWVLRFCRREFGLDNMEILSVDTHEGWLSKSADWVAAQGLDSRGFALWQDAEDRPYDLVLLDIERPPSRNGYLPHTLTRFCSPGTHLVLDDLHVPSYRLFVHETLAAHNYRHVDLKRFTIDRFGRYASVYTDIC